MATKTSIHSSFFPLQNREMKRILTDLFLEVTEDSIDEIAHKAYKEARQEAKKRKTEVSRESTNNGKGN